MAKRRPAQRAKKKKQFRPDGQQMDPRYYLPNIKSGKGWEADNPEALQRQQKKELARLKKNVRARIQRLKGSEYAEIGMKRLQEMPFADVLLDPSAFSTEEQLAAFARISEENISISGIRREQKMREEWAVTIAGAYQTDIGSLGFNEVMAAARYSGLIDSYGSEAVARYAESIEDQNLDATQIFQNIGSFLAGR